MKHLLFLFFSFSIAGAMAQKQNDEQPPAYYNNNFCKATYPNVHVQNISRAEDITQALTVILPALQDNRCRLQLNYRNESLAGIHYSYTQLFNGIPVYQSEIKVNTDKANTILSIFDNSYDTKNWNPDVTAAKTNSVIAIDPVTQRVVLAELTNNNQLETLSAGSEVLFRRDMNTYLLPPDSTVIADVFNPDPLTTANKIYNQSPVYKNNNDTNVTWLSNQLERVTFKAFYDGTRFSLKSDYVSIEDFDAPNIAPPTSLLPAFLYNRSQNGFEDVNAYYHLTTFQSYIAGMGFTDLANKEIAVDAHANGNSSNPDNSFFAPSYQPQRIYYGIGGVNDAEDADVIVHEYGHFLSYNASPGSNSGFERNALDEAFGDYLAASYSRSINTFNQDWVFNWDGHNEYWNGRVVNSPKKYPENMGSSFYGNSEIWSAVLFAINKEIGRGATDSLILEAHYSYAGGISMIDAAMILQQVDTLLFNGAHFCPIYKQLLTHGLAEYDSANVCGFGNLGIHEEELTGFTFIQHDNQFTIKRDEGKPFTASVYNLLGAQITTLSSTGNLLTYSDANLPAGMSLVNIRSGNGSRTFKWIKEN